MAMISLGILFSLVVVLYPMFIHLILSVLLCVSGVITNLILAICFVCVWPISDDAYTRLNSAVKKFDWLVLVYLVDLFAGVKVLVYTEQETIRLMGKDHAFLLSNARSDANHLVGLVLVQWTGCLGSLLAVIKTSTNYIVSDPQWLKDFPQPFWLSFYLERTGFTRKEFVAAQKLPVSSNILSGHMKDLVYSVRYTCSVVPAIYDVTVAILKTPPSPTLETVCKGRPSVVHVYIKRHLTMEYPETDEAVDKWHSEIHAAKVHVHIIQHATDDKLEADDAMKKCVTDKLAAKEALLDKYKAERTFGGQGFQAIGQALKSFLAVISLACLLMLGAVKFNVIHFSTLFVSSAALFCGCMLAIIGFGVLSLLKCFIQAAVADISWSKNVSPICDRLVDMLWDAVMALP